MEKIIVGIMAIVCIMICWGYTREITNTTQGKKIKANEIDKLKLRVEIERLKLEQEKEKTKRQRYSMKTEIEKNKRWQNETSCAEN